MYSFILNKMETQRGYYYDQSLLLMLSAHILFPCCVFGINNVTVDGDKNTNVHVPALLDESSGINNGNISGIHSVNQTVKVTNETKHTENGSDTSNKLGKKRQSFQQKTILKLFENVICNFTEEGSTCANTTSKDGNQISNLSSRPGFLNISHVNISEPVFNNNEKEKVFHLNPTLHQSAVTSELETGNLSGYTGDSISEHGNVTIVNTEYTDYDHDVEHAESATFSQIGTDSTNFTETIEDYTSSKDKHVRKHIKRQAHTIWQNKHYIRSVVVPVTCGIIGALALVCVGYALRSCPRNNLYINDYDTFKVEDDSVVVNDRLMLLVDSSDEEL